MPKVGVARPLEFNKEMPPPRYQQTSHPGSLRRVGLSQRLGSPEGGGEWRGTERIE